MEGLDVRVVGAVGWTLCSIPVRGPPQHGVHSNNMALITSDCGTMRSLRIKWP